MAVAALGAMLGAACGDSLAVPDATPPPEDHRGQVSVQVLADSVASGWAVVFQEADGKLALATRTGQDGRANARMGPGGTVTLVAQSGSSWTMYTWREVALGDELVLDTRLPTKTGRTTSIVVETPEDPGASQYQLWTRCGSPQLNPGPTATFVDLVGCGTKADLLLVTFGQAFHYLFADDVALANNVHVPFVAPYRPLDQTTVEVVHVPPDRPTLLVTQALIDDGHELFGPSTFGLGSAQVAAVDGSAMLTHEMVAPPGGTLMTSVDPPSLFGVDLGSQHVVQWGPAAAFTRVDLAETTLRAYRGSPVYQHASHQVRWTEDAAGRVADTVLAELAWFRPSTGENFQWMLLAPRGEATVLDVPVLPDLRLGPTAADTTVQAFALTSIASEGGYASLRAWLLGRWLPNGPWPATGPSGRVLRQDLTNQGLERR